MLSPAFRPPTDCNARGGRPSDVKGFALRIVAADSLAGSAFGPRRPHQIHPTPIVTNQGSKLKWMWPVEQLAGEQVNDPKVNA